MLIEITVNRSINHINIGVKSKLVSIKVIGAVSVFSMQ
jgi:hypothetical protein